MVPYYAHNLQAGLDMNWFLRRDEGLHCWQGESSGFGKALMGPQSQSSNVMSQDNTFPIIDVIAHSPGPTPSSDVLVH